MVRKPAQVEILRSQESAEYILDSSSPDFTTDLQVMCDKLQPRCMLDSVAGELTGIILKAMPKNSTAYVYGVLSLQPIQCEANELIFKNKAIKGLWVTAYLRTKSLFQ